MHHIADVCWMVSAGCRLSQLTFRLPSGHLVAGVVVCFWTVIRQHGARVLIDSHWLVNIRRHFLIYFDQRGETNLDNPSLNDIETESFHNHAPRSVGRQLSSACLTLFFSVTVIIAVTAVYNVKWTACEYNTSSVSGCGQKACRVVSAHFWPVD
ncbi:hypothetical protein BaRGS_00016350 [Batillaria attramentaria]|uniref:Uncharacterized protein n=1 Tax=Batillaria attramentaria TaxID=370345 RepID=A0ABD0L0C0_9CAEN